LKEHVKTIYSVGFLAEDYVIDVYLRNFTSNYKVKLQNMTENKPSVRKPTLYMRVFDYDEFHLKWNERPLSCNEHDWNNSKIIKQCNIAAYNVLIH
jgi:hypothetical protein